MLHVILTFLLRDLYRIFSNKSISYLAVFVLLLIPFGSKAQFDPYAVVEGVDPTVMVQQVLIGQGVQTSNITYTGSVTARGTFSGDSNLGIATGLILTSGRANYSEGPNNTGSKSYDANTAGDAALTQLCGSGTNDACVLEFDFIPQSNIVEFRYVFGSEEYPEYVNQFNDVFGFFISGPDIYGPYPSPPGFPNGARNIALVPQTLPPYIVSIDNINNGNSNNGPCMNCEYYVNNGTGTTPNVNQYIQYDGFTTVLVASSNVVPCQTYHIKLAVADAGDDAYDTGVFLEANSFSSVGLGANLAYTHAAVDTAVEACNNASVAFELFQITPVDYTINLEIGGTAENGVDYEFIPDQIIIPEGDTMAVLPINAIDDGIYEFVTETVTLIYNSSLCGVDMDTLTVYIKDYPIMGVIASGDQTMVCGEIRKLRVTPYGGIPPFTYAWDTGETSDTLNVSPDVTTTYTVIVTDECGSQEIREITVTVLGPEANAGEDIPICQNESTTLTAQGGTSWLWMPGGLTDPVITVSPVTTTTYTLTSYDECGNSDTDEVTVFVDEPFADAGIDEGICVGQPVTLTANDTPNGTWVWTDQLTGDTYNGREITVTPLTSRTYCVDVTDNCSNTLTDCVDVTVFQLTVDAGTDPTICAGDPAELTGTSSTGSGVFSWFDGTNTFTGQTVSVLPLATTTYTLTVNDGCEATDQVIVTVNQLPVVSAASSVSSICPDEQLTLTASGAIDYTWSSDPVDLSLNGQENSLNPLVGPLENTNYTLIGTDANGCSNSSIIGITVKERMFADFALSDIAACEGEPLQVTYTGNGQTYATYDWSFDGGVTSTTGQGPHSVTWTGPGPRNVSLTVTQSGCMSELVNIPVTVNALPVADYSAGLTEGCVPLTVDFTDLTTNTVTGTIYSWDMGGIAGSSAQSPTQDFSIPGQYDITLTVTNPGGCVSYKSVATLVDAWPLPVADFDANPASTSLKNPVVQFSSNSTGDDISLLWNTGDGTTYDTPVFTHTYIVSDYFDVVLTVTNSFGCVDSTLKQVYVSPKYALQIPTAFTPNGDGVNDAFTIRGSGVKEFSISIFNRWGSLIFFTNDIAESWDGKIDGQPAGKGIYVYHTYFRDDNDEVSEQTGSINLVR
ncbi:MAG: choice-of-anchor L domain-containing protein [Lentimicrobium sp.]